MSVKDPRLTRMQVEQALMRLEQILKAQPGSALRIHTHLDRRRGIALLDALLDSDDEIMPPHFS